MSRGRRGQTPIDFAVGAGVFLIVVAFVVLFVPQMLEPYQDDTQRNSVTADRVATDVVEGMLATPGSPTELDRACTIAFFESDAENTDGDGEFDPPVGAGSPVDAEMLGCAFRDVPLGERVGVGGTGASRVNLRVELIADLDSEEGESPDADTDSIDGEAFTDDDTPDTLCLDANDPRITEAEDPYAGGTACDLTGGDDDVLFAVGDPAPSGTTSVVVSRRFVTVEGGFVDGSADATLLVEVWG